MAEVITGPLWEGCNWASEAGEGSIHDEKTASKLGFRGGTVPGDVHMNQFPPVLMALFGQQWFERGNLSLNFKNATVDRERVKVFAEQPDTEQASNEQQARVWMEREDGLLVCEGTATLGDHSQSYLRQRDLRPCEPAELRILNEVHSGMSLGKYETLASPDKQFAAYDNGTISDPLDWYRTGSPWGDVIAAPSTLVQILWGLPMAGLRPLIGEAVGLFGAIEIGQVNGPLMLNREYLVSSEVVCVGQSPQTEYLWFDATATNDAGQLIATFRMMLRFMKQSSPAYQ